MTWAVKRIPSLLFEEYEQLKQHNAMQPAHICYAEDGKVNMVDAMISRKMKYELRKQNINNILKMDNAIYSGRDFLKQAVHSGKI